MLSFDAMTDYESYKDKRVVVTGATSGIGRQTADSFLHQVSNQKR